MARVRQMDRNVRLDAARTRAEHGHAIGHEDGFIDIVGHEHHRLALGLPDAQQQFLHQNPGLVVQRTEGLVHEQDLGIVGQRTRDRRALLHAARQLLGVVILEPAQAHLGNEVVAALFLNGFAHAFLAQSEADVLRHGQPGEQGVALKHHAAVGAGLLHQFPVQQHLPRRREIQTRNNAQHRRFAAAGGPENGHEIVLPDLEIHRQQRLGADAFVAGEGARNALNGQLVHHRELHSNMRRLTVLKMKSDTRPMSPMMMMPKMICPVLSSAWLSVIMCPIPEDEPISSATIT